MKTLETFRAVYAQRFTGAQTITQRTGRPVIGYLDAGFPEEIAIAAGMVPVLVTADPQQVFVHTKNRMDLGTPHRIAAIFEGLIAGKYAGLTRLCVTNGDRFLANLYGLLEAEADVLGRPVLPHVMFLDRARGSYAEHWAFNRAAMEKLALDLGAVTGRKVDEVALRAAIAQTNRARALVAQLRDYHLAHPQVLGGADMALVQICARLMPKEDFIAAAEALLAELPAAPSEAAVCAKTFLCGSAIDHIALHAAMGQAGTLLCGDATSFTGRYAHDALRADIAPLDALADQKTLGFPEPWAFGRDYRLRCLIAACEASGATEAIYLHLAEDSAAGWDFPDLRNALATRGITLKYLRDFPQAYSDPAQLKTWFEEAIQ